MDSSSNKRLSPAAVVALKEAQLPSSEFVTFELAQIHEEFYS